MTLSRTQNRTFAKLVFYYKAFVYIPLISNFTVLEMYETVDNAKHVLLINPNHH